MKRSFLEHYFSYGFCCCFSCVIRCIHIFHLPFAVNIRINIRLHFTQQKIVNINRKKLFENRHICWHSFRRSRQFFFFFDSSSLHFPQHIICSSSVVSLDVTDYWFAKWKTRIQPTWLDKNQILNKKFVIFAHFLCRWSTSNRTKK